MTYDQSEFDVRCEWGLQGVRLLAPISDVVIIVDVLSFSTCVDIATGRGAIVYPYRWKDASAEAFALSVDGELAGPSNQGYTLSPRTLVSIPFGTRLVLPSPNGSTLTLSTGSTPTLAGCLRNAVTVGQAAQRYGRRIAVIPAGEQWPDGSLRPAFEDWLGAGAILHGLSGEKSPEASAAVACFLDAQPDLLARLNTCSSGKEKQERGQTEDNDLAGALNTSTAIPVFKDGAYRSGS